MESNPASGTHNHDKIADCVLCAVSGVIPQENKSAAIWSHEDNWLFGAVDKNDAELSCRSDDITTLIITALSLPNDRIAGLKMSGTARILRIVTPFSVTDDATPALCAGHLRDVLRRLQGLEAVIAIGASAHLAVLTACGIPTSRAPYRPGMVTQLPDGLHIAAAEATLSAPSAKRLMATLALALTKTHSDAA